MEAHAVLCVCSNTGDGASAASVDLLSTLSAAPIGCNCGVLLVKPVVSPTGTMHTCQPHLQAIMASSLSVITMENLE